MNIKQEAKSSDHWKEVNEEIIVTSNGEEIVNYIYVFNTRFNINDLVRIEDSTVFAESEKSMVSAAGFEYTDAGGLGVLVKFKSSRGDLYYQGGAINDY